MRRTTLSPLATFTLALVACGGAEGASTKQYEVTARYPHDSAAYTQGLIWTEHAFYESTGLYGHSEVRRVDLKTGKVLASRALPSTRFGEGLALLGGKLYQITWQSEVGYTYDAESLAPIDSFTYKGEGWGLATDGTSLFMSDGSDSLRVVSPAGFTVQKVVHVKFQGAPVKKLNELEFVGPDLFANIYETNQIARIDPASGEVKALIDFNELYPKRPPWAEVMNGIAIAPATGELLVTGKNWPVIFQVRLK